MKMFCLNVYGADRYGKFVLHMMGLQWPLGKDALSLKLLEYSATLAITELITAEAGRRREKWK